jgi:hypothetical protein
MKLLTDYQIELLKDLLADKGTTEAERKAITEKLVDNQISAQAAYLLKIGR